MLAEVRLVLTPKEARLTVRRGDDFLEDEVWTLTRQLGRAEAQEMAMVIFGDAYDMMNCIVHGDD